MTTTLDLRPIDLLEDRQFAVRDFLIEENAGRFTAATLHLIDGTIAKGSHPQLVTPIDPLIDRDGNYLSDVAVLAIALDPKWTGSARLSDVDFIELEGRWLRLLTNRSRIRPNWSGALRAVAELEEQQVPVEPTAVAEATGLELDFV